MRRVIGGLLIGLALAAPSAPTHAQMQSRPQPRVGPLPPALRVEIETLLRDSPVRGAAVVLVDAHGPTGALWYGLADRASRLPMSATTCGRVGAVSQTLTAILALRLADQGKLSLDDPLPAQWQPARPPACATAVTAAQLLEHTAGIADAGRDASPEEIARRPLAACPGLHTRDADDGITLAAAVLAQAGGADFEILMQREVMAPLAMGTARFGSGPAPACLSTSYRADGAELPPTAAHAPPAAGGLIATPLQLASVLQMLLRYGAGPAGHMLEPCSIAHMAVGTTGLAARQGASAGSYGKGLKRFVAAGRWMLGATGRSDGFQTLIGFAPDSQRGMVIQLNTADEASFDKLRDAVAAHLWRDLPPQPLPAMARPVDGIAGWYVKAGPAPSWAGRATGAGLVRIEQDDGGLTLRNGWWPWAEPRRVLAVTEHSFRDASLPLASMAFARAEDGQRWWIDGGSYRALPGLAEGVRQASTPLGLLTLGVPTLLLWRRRMRKGRLRVTASALAVGPDAARRGA